MSVVPGMLELPRNPSLTPDRLIAARRRLRDGYGADVLLTGCAGMALHRDRIQEALSILVLEPAYVAVGILIGATHVHAALP